VLGSKMLSNRTVHLPSLTRENFALELDPPSIRLGAADTKNRRDTLQPVRPDLAEAVASWRGGKRPGEPLLSIPSKSAKMLHRDMGAARRRWIEQAKDEAEREARERSPFLRPVDDGGRRADFHALRHTFVTQLVSSGVPMKAAQELARHSDPKLTLGVYAHTQLRDLSTALESLPSFTERPRHPEAARATGTHGQEHPIPETPKGASPQKRPQSRRDSSRLVATPCDSTEASPATFASENTRKRRRIVASCETVQHSATTRPVGVEPTTCDLGNRCSIQLSYGRLGRAIVQPR